MFNQWCLKYSIKGIDKGPRLMKQNYSRLNIIPREYNEPNGQKNLFIIKLDVPILRKIFDRKELVLSGI